MESPLLRLPPIPPYCTVLKDADARRLARFGGNIWNSPRTECRTCHLTKRFTGIGPDGQPAQYECDCVSQWMLFRWYLNAGISYRYQTLSWDDALAVPGPVLDVVSDYCMEWEQNRDRGLGLTLWSPNTGTGKTMLATLVLKAIMSQGGVGYFCSFNEMLTLNSSGWRDKDEREWFSRRVATAQLLVIDDIGRENKGRVAMVESIFDDVIRRRVADGQPTVITTNETPEEMRQGYGHNILSLLSEVNTEIEMPGSDYRPVMNQSIKDNAKSGITKPITDGL